MENLKNNYLSILEKLNSIDNNELAIYYSNNKNSIDYFCQNIIYEYITDINNINQRQIISIVVKKLSSFFDNKYLDNFFNYIEAETLDFP